MQLAYAELDVFADYNSFMVQDETARLEPDRAWTRALISDMIAARDGVVGVGTARRTTVPVILDVRTHGPVNDFDGWDHVTEAGLHIESGTVIVSMLDCIDAVPRITVPAGSYTARIYAAGFGTISSDGIHGDDLYHVVLWPGAIRKPQVLARAGTRLGAPADRHPPAQPATGSSALGGEHIGRDHPDPRRKPGCGALAEPNVGSAVTALPFDVNASRRSEAADLRSDDRTLLLDLENLGCVRLRPRPLRTRLAGLLAAAGPIHHAVAAYAVPDEADGDPLASMLAELRIASLRVQPGPDAAELALLAHARYVHTEGGRIFLVGSADGRFAELAALGRVDLLVWDGQPVATKLAEVVHDIHRLARPTSAPAGDITEPMQREPAATPSTMPAGAAGVPGEPARAGSAFAGPLLTAFATGIAIAAGHRLFDALLPRRRR
ncbi:hypothetical protein SAMN04489727_2018 [Amycolatopsis tolypomycina]|uniref:Uncharacterized protein n=2 Tax=Amycolatopsis tolypomycina TaxID=208445 RepID=A0A1H4JMJ3_9PSEU|nr:hypothetical protein SAMN04489727_2018 [Amycolatopsis tolypomycina]